MELSKQQKRAVESDAQYMAIIAGAGSGKTRTLTERICNLIENKNVKAEAILALTFTSKAAGEMKKRVIDNIGDKAKGIWIKTFHSFGLQLLRIFPEYSGLPEKFEIADTGLKNHVINTIANKHKLSIEPKSLLAKISYIKNGINPCDEDFKELFDEYNSVLRANNCIDLDDMIWLTSSMIKNHKEVQTFLHQRFEYVLVDEYQDTNEEQEELIKLILSDTASLCIVGDDDQCIYEWRGSKPDLIRQFADRKDVETIYLSDNYRSQKYIVDIANRFIKNNLKRILKRMFSKVTPSAKPQYYKAVNEENEASIICSIIKSLCDDGSYKYNDIAILIRSTKQAQPICSALRGNFIPYSRKKENANFLYMEIIKVLNTIIDIEKNNNISRGINFPNSVLDNFTYMDLVDDYNLNDLTVIEALEHIYENDSITWDNCSYFRERYEKLIFLNELVDTNENIKTSEILGMLYEVYDTQLQSMGIENDEKLKLLSMVIEINREWEKTVDSPDIVSFVDYLMCALENEEEMLDFDEEDCVNIMTCHKSKGLEFPVVIIPGVQVGNFPNDFFVHSADDLEQERRLFYVAITRAVDKLYITSYGNPFSSSENIFVNKGFVAEIPELIEWRNERRNVNTQNDKNNNKTVLENSSGISLDTTPEQYMYEIVDNYIGGYTESDFGCPEEYAEYLENGIDFD